MAGHQRPRRIRLRHGGRAADAALSRAARRRVRPARPAPGARLEIRRDRLLSRRDVRVGRDALARRDDRAARLPLHRAVSARRQRAGLDVRVCRRAAREARMDGARREHDVRDVHARPCERASRAARKGALPTGATTTRSAMPAPSAPSSSASIDGVRSTRPAASGRSSSCSRRRRSPATRTNGTSASSTRKNARAASMTSATCSTPATSPPN